MAPKRAVFLGRHGSRLFMAVHHAEHLLAYTRICDAEPPKSRRVWCVVRVVGTAAGGLNVAFPVEAAQDASFYEGRSEIALAGKVVDEEL